MCCYFVLPFWWIKMYIKALFCVISVNSGSFRAHYVKVHVRYLISWWVLVSCASLLSPWHVSLTTVIILAVVIITTGIVEKLRWNVHFCNVLKTQPRSYYKHIQCVEPYCFIFLFMSYLIFSKHSRSSKVTASSTQPLIIISIIIFQ